LYICYFDTDFGFALYTYNILFHEKLQEKKGNLNGALKEHEFSDHLSQPN